MARLRRVVVESVTCDSVHLNLSGHYHRRIDRDLTDVLHGALTDYWTGGPDVPEPDWTPLVVCVLRLTVPATTSSSDVTLLVK